MGISRRAIRWIVTGLFGALFTLMLAPVVGEFFVELARESGAYDRPSDTVAAAMTFLATLTSSWWLGVVLGFLGGLAAAFWSIDWFTRRWNKKFIVDNLNRLFAVGSNISTRKILNDAEFASWETLYNSWNNECNKFITDNISVYDGTKSRYIHVQDAKNYVSFSPDHNRLLNVVRTKLVLLEEIINRYSRK